MGTYYSRQQHDPILPAPAKAPSPPPPLGRSTYEDFGVVALNQPHSQNQ
jgi:hypothetical protein